MEKHSSTVVVLLVSVVCFSMFCFSEQTDFSSKMGICYGQLGNNLPSPAQSIQLIQSMKAGSVKLYDANPEILHLLAQTDLQVSIMLPNGDISGIAASDALADEWITKNVLAYYPQTRIRTILVGNEILSYSSDQDRQIWVDLVPAMRRLKRSLRDRNVHNIKIGTPLAMDMLQSSFPPSDSQFRSEISDLVMRPLLTFLNRTNSFFYLDVYPYFPWSSNPTNISLDYALFRGQSKYTDPGSGLVYDNLLDQMLDSVIFAMAKLGFPNIRLNIAETGWPNSGDIDEPGANVVNAAIYNRNLVKRITKLPAIGTPARPGVFIPTYLFSLYDENQKSGPGTERHWGLLSPTGQPNYEIDLTGNAHRSNYSVLPIVANDKPYAGKLWCVVAENADEARLVAAMSYACSQGDEVCDELTRGKECYEPNTIDRHASYAFSSYWARFRDQGAHCYFGGLAKQTSDDPSRGSCEFPSVTV